MLLATRFDAPSRDCASVLRSERGDWPRPAARPGPPRTVESVLVPALLADALILAGVIHDMRTRGRPHPAYVIGGALMLAVQVLREPSAERRCGTRSPTSSRGSVAERTNGGYI